MSRAEQMKDWEDLLAAYHDDGTAELLPREREGTGSARRLAAAATAYNIQENQPSRSQETSEQPIPMIYGDYKCPYCRYYSLQRHATRCPLCQGTIGDDYWPPILSKEAAAATAREQERLRLQELAQEEFQRTRPAREEAERRRAASEATAKAVSYAPVGCIAGGFLGALAGGALGWAIEDREGFLVVAMFFVGAVVGTVRALHNARGPKIRS